MLRESCKRRNFLRLRAAGLRYKNGARVSAGVQLALSEYLRHGWRSLASQSLLISGSALRKA